MRGETDGWIQLELPFEELIYKEDALENEDAELAHYDNPKNDNERLLNYQYEFKKGDMTALGKMYELSIEVCLALIGKIGQKNSHVKNLSWEEKMNKAHDAATYLPARYLKKKQFFIKKSFTGYLYLRVLGEVYKGTKRKVDKIVDFVDLDEFFKESEDYGNFDEN